MNPLMLHPLFQKLIWKWSPDWHSLCIHNGVAVYTPLTHRVSCGWYQARLLWWSHSPLHWICFIFLMLLVGLLFINLSQVALIVSKYGGQDTKGITVDMWLYPLWHTLIQTLQVWVVLWRFNVGCATCEVCFHFFTGWTIRCVTGFVTFC
jgi:hypothetical protein